MFPYTVEYTESEYDIQNNNLLSKTHKQCKNTFEALENVGKSRKIENTRFYFYYLYKFHSSYFVNFVNVVIWGFLKFYIYIYIYITRVGSLH